MTDEEKTFLFDIENQIDSFHKATSSTIKESEARVSYFESEKIIGMLK